MSPTPLQHSQQHRPRQPSPSPSPSPAADSRDDDDDGTPSTSTSTSTSAFTSNRRNAHAMDVPLAAVAAAEAESANRHHAQANAAVDIASALSRHLSSDLSHAPGSTAAALPEFRSFTIAPSPPVPAPAARARSPAAVPQDPAEDLGHLSQSPEFLPYHSTPAPSRSAARRPVLSLHHKSSAQSLRPVSRTPSLKTGSVYGPFGSASAASSTVPSPVISAMGDVTPLPSPLLASDSPGPWRQLGRRTSRDAALTHQDPARSEPTVSATPSRSPKKAYTGLTSWPAAADNTKRDHDSNLAQPPILHTRNRSISEYIPDPMLIPKRMSTVSGTRAKPDIKTMAETHMRREPHLSEARGLTPVEKPPTPPPSESSLSAAESSSAAGSGSSTRSKPPRAEFFEAYGRYDRKRRRWRAIEVLGQGTFSQVYLATGQASSSASDDEDCSPGSYPQDVDPLRERRSLVAVKVCEHGPRGGASEDRIEMSLKRELEIMQSIRHPSLVHLKAWSIEPTRAILVLSYYPGGDLFDVATRHRSLLTPSLIRRMFSELVGAVTYLHAQNVVHRDIKLENVLVNLCPSELSHPPTTDWTTYPHAVITLTDLGLSRRVAPDEKLETRCGSDDYAAPEVIMGQPYDGRATDAWSLGVLLYALLEARLPFDPPPAPGPAGLDHAMQMRMRSRTSHRIARVEWRWFDFGVAADDADGGEGEHEADAAKFEAKGLRGAREAVEALLKRARSRWPLVKVAAMEWVSGGVCVEGGIRFREEEEGEEVP